MATCNYCKQRLEDDLALSRYLKCSTCDPAIHVGCACQLARSTNTNIAVCLDCHVPRNAMEYMPFGTVAVDSIVKLKTVQLTTHNNFNDSHSMVAETINAVTKYAAPGFAEAKELRRRLEMHHPLYQLGPLVVTVLGSVSLVGFVQELRGVGTPSMQAVAAVTGFTAVVLGLVLATLAAVTNLHVTFIPWGVAAVAAVPLTYGTFSASDSGVITYVAVCVYSLVVCVLYWQWWNNHTSKWRVDTMRLRARNHILREMARDVHAHIAKQCSDAMARPGVTQQLVFSIQAIMVALNSLARLFSVAAPIGEAHRIELT